MSSNNSEDLKAEFQRFAKSAYLDILVPKTADFDAGALLRDGSPEEIQRAPSRRHLFFDEYTKLQIVLRSTTPGDELLALIQYLSLAVSANATDAIPAEGRANTTSASGKHDVAAQTFAAAEKVNIVSIGEQTYAVWRPAIHLLRPRARLQKPAIYFTANLSLSAEALSTSREDDKDYLKSYEPLPANVLEPLRFDPSLSRSNIYLSETRITKVAPPAARSDVFVKPIRGASKRAFPCVPALFTRIKYSPLPDSSIVSLHIETSQMIAGSVSVQEASLAVPGVQVASLNAVSWPQLTHAGDEIILLYKLEQRKTGKMLEIATSPLATVFISATAELDQGSQIQIEIRLQNPVDLIQTPKVTHQWSRPLSASLSPHQPLPLFSGSNLTSSDLTAVQNTVDGCIVFHFTAPPSTRVLSEFALGVQCINKSNRAYRFALVNVQARKAALRASQQQLPTDPQGNNASLITGLYKSPPPQREEPPDVLYLNPDCQIGPLPPGACFETEMRFRAVAMGVLDLGLVRIVDLDTMQTVDLKELPDVIALEPTGDGD